MHELSLVRSLIRQVDTIVAEQGGGEVTEIRVSIGPLSGVEPMLVQNAYHQLVSATPLATAELRIDCVELTATCQGCGESFFVESFCFRCVACQSPNVRITSGDEFRLLSVSVQEDRGAHLNGVSVK